MTLKRSNAFTLDYVGIDTLRADVTNPRRMSERDLDALTRSIDAYGLVQPVLARRDDHTVIGGHQRLLAARRLGYREVPVIYVDLAPEPARLLNLALNRISGDWDQELLARLLADLSAVPDLDVSLAGFGEDELKGLLRGLDRREKRERVEVFDLDAALEQAQRQPRTQPGDLWQLGEHRLLCGDATDPAMVDRLLDGRHAALAFSDPPYGVAYGDHGGQQEGAKKRRIQNDALSPEAWEIFCRGWAANLLRATDGAVYVCMSTKEWPTVSRVLAEAGGHWSTTVIWTKDHFTLGRSDYQRAFEPLWYGWREGTSHFWCGDRDQGDVWNIARPTASPLHPTMKPLPLIERAIENSSRPGDLVLDLFLGSGSTLIACERTGRVCAGTELDPLYCDIIVSRWEPFTREQGVKA